MDVSAICPAEAYGSWVNPCLGARQTPAGFGHQERLANPKNFARCVPLQETSCAAHRENGVGQRVEFPTRLINCNPPLKGFEELLAVFCFCVVSVKNKMFTPHMGYVIWI